MEVISGVLALLAMLGAIHLVGSAWLTFEYAAKAKWNQYKVPKKYAAKWILITGFRGLVSSCDDVDGIFWRHIQARMDADRTNAADIADCKANLRRLEALPRTDTALKAAGLERHRLATLRAHDNEVAATIGVSVLAPDLAATSASITTSQTTLSAIRPSSS